MKEDLAFENLVLREALKKSQSHNEQYGRLVRTYNIEAELLEKKATNRGVFSVLLASAATLATGISIYYKNVAEETTHALQTETHVRAREFSTNANKIADLATRLKQAQATRNDRSVFSETHHPKYDTFLIGSHKEKVEELNEIFGEDYLRRVLKQDIEDDVPVRPEKTAVENVVIDGSNPNIPAADLGKYLRGFPSDWIHGKVKKISLRQEQYGGHVSYARNGKILGSFSSDSQKIEIYSAVIQKNNFPLFDRTVAHEIAHGNDWIRNNQLTAEERVDLLAKIAARLMSSDHYVSAYVEIIETNDPQTTAIHKHEEYFAEISAAFFNNPTELNYKDFLIIHNLVNKGDASYNIEHGVNRRTISPFFDTSL